MTVPKISTNIYLYINISVNSFTIITYVVLLTLSCTLEKKYILTVGQSVVLEIFHQRFPEKLFHFLNDLLCQMFHLRAVIFH